MSLPVRHERASRSQCALVMVGIVRHASLVNIAQFRRRAAALGSERRTQKGTGIGSCTAASSSRRIARSRSWWN